MFLLFPKLRSIHHVFLVLLSLWSLIFFYHERYVPYRTAHKCRWPELNQNDNTTNVMLVADPQLIDNHTYPGRNSLLLDISKHTADVYLRKNYKFMTEVMKPDYIFFLGDYLDNGRGSTNEYFFNELLRFKRVFAQEDYKRGENAWLNLPGNHDIGFGDMVIETARERFEKQFGAPNTIVTIDGVDFIILDTISLSSSKPEVNGKARAFVDENFGSKTKEKPRVLLTHVPLFRDTEKDTCGPHRESPVFHTSAGYQYQLALDPGLTAELLEKIQPDIVFSGDDHDYCDTMHSSVDPHVREITVKSISMAMGVWYPAVQVLSFASAAKNSQTPTSLMYQSHLCYLPTPYINIAAYVTMAVISGLIILYFDVKQKSPRYGYSVLPLSTSTQSESTTSKKISKFLKDQDEGYIPSTSLPAYTATSSSTKDVPFLVLFKYKFLSFLKKWNIYGFLKHLLLMATIVIFIYYVGFCLTI